jgi:hypothetical protein
MSGLSIRQFGGQVVINQITDFDGVIEFTISFFIYLHARTTDGCLS